MRYSCFTSGSFSDYSNGCSKQAHFRAEAEAEADMAMAMAIAVAEKSSTGSPLA